MNINPEEVHLTITKNLSTSFGLTLVAGLPLPLQLSLTLQKVQARLESIHAGCFQWYQPAQMHVTLSALLRGRYRECPPIQRNELPRDVDAFFREFINFMARQLPLQIIWQNYFLTTNGLLIRRAQCNERFSSHLIDLLGKYLDFDPPKKQPNDLHLTIGYLISPEQFIDSWDESLMKTLVALLEYEMEIYRVDRVWLVHYSNRTLNTIIGRVPFMLGKRESIKSETVLHQLHIK